MDVNNADQKYSLSMIFERFVRLFQRQSATKKIKTIFIHNFLSLCRWKNPLRCLGIDEKNN